MKFLTALLLVSASSFAAELKTVWVCDSAKHKVIIKDFKDKANRTTTSLMLALTVKDTNKTGNCLGGDDPTQDGGDYDCLIDRAWQSGELHWEYITVRTTPSGKASTLDYRTDKDDVTDTINCVAQ